MATAAIPVTKSPQIELIEQYNFAWVLDPEGDITKLLDTVQVRESQHYSPKEVAESYRHQMGEKKFDPIVATRDNKLVDGFTRRTAYLAREQKFAPIIVLQEDYDKMPRKRQLEVRSLAADLNMLNGVRLTKTEVLMSVRDRIELGWKDEAIARALGVGGSTVDTVRKNMAAEKKLASVGLAANGNLKGTSKKALGHRDVQALHDEPFKELVDLATKAGFNASEITATAKALAEAGSDDAQVARLAEIRSENNTRIRERERTGTNRPPLARRLRQSLGFGLKYQGNDEDGQPLARNLIETDLAVVDKHVGDATAHIEVMQAMLAAQAEWVASVTPAESV